MTLSRAARQCFAVVLSLALLRLDAAAAAAVKLAPAALGLSRVGAFVPSAILVPASLPQALQPGTVGLQIPTVAAGDQVRQYTAALPALQRALSVPASEQGVKMDQIFDASSPAQRSLDTGLGVWSFQGIPAGIGGGAKVSGASSKKAGGASDALAAYEKWQKAAAEREKKFMAKVAAVRVGPFGFSMGVRQVGEGALQIVSGYTFNGKPFSSAELNAKLESGETTKQQWQEAQVELQKAVVPLKLEYKKILERTAQELERVQRKMAAFEIKAPNKGEALEAWGVPNVVAINQETYMRYTRLYRLGGKPTDLGSALYDILEPLVKADPNFLGKVTQAQFDEAVQLLQDSLKYKVSGDSDETEKLMRLGFVSSDEDYDYPEWRKAFADRARDVLTSAPRAGDASANLGLTPKERRPIAILRQMLASIEKRVEHMDPKQKEVVPLAKLAAALHVAMGTPLDIAPGKTIAIPVEHQYLRPVLAELARIKAHPDVIAAVIRAFPLGESLWRLGVDKEWGKQRMGKGIKIAIIDNGVDFDHPDFNDANGTLSENMTRDRGGLTKGKHGTPMASILHAIAPDAEIHSYQALSNSRLPGVALNGQETDAALFRAMDRAKENGAQIISMSLGAAMGYSNDDMAKKIAEFAKEGIIVVVAAGNEGDELPPGFQVGSPGTSHEAITVGAVDYHGRKAPFSSAGLVFNPDHNTIEQKPDVYSYGVNVKAAMQLPAGFYRKEPVPYMHGSGTSPATPHIAGVVALMLQAARDAGLPIAGPGIVEAARAALRAAVSQTLRLPVLESATKAVDEFLKLLRPAA